MSEKPSFPSSALHRRFVWARSELRKLPIPAPGAFGGFCAGTVLWGVAGATLGVPFALTGVFAGGPTHCNTKVVLSDGAAAANEAHAVNSTRVSVQRENNG